MCTVCGCGAGQTMLDGKALTPREASASTAAGGDAQGSAHQHYHRHDDGSWHSHAHGPGAGHTLGDGQFAASSFDYSGGRSSGLSQTRMLQVERNILAKNDAHAAANRQLFAERGIFVVNLVSSPGSGKTTLLVKTIGALGQRMALAVIEGDQQTSVDAERIRASGAPAIQLNTGKGCHLDAHMVGHGVEALKLADDSLLLIENVGNLVCPAEFDLGEACKVVILSVTEGEDKPLKYPNMFAAAKLMLLNKVDLLPHLEFEVERCVANARRVNPDIEVIEVSAASGVGMDRWIAWLERGLWAARSGRAETVAALRQRINELEAQLAARPA